MPVYMIERNFAEQLDVSPDDAVGIKEVNDDAGVKWLLSFLSADKRKTYCLYEAATAEEIRVAAEKVGIPADVITEVGELSPDCLTGAVKTERFAT